jgi:hypothetical protein
LLVLTTLIAFCKFSSCFAVITSATFTASNTVVATMWIAWTPSHAMCYHTAQCYIHHLSSHVPHHFAKAIWLHYSLGYIPLKFSTSVKKGELVLKCVDVTSLGTTS